MTNEISTALQAILTADKLTFASLADVGHSFYVANRAERKTRQKFAAECATYVRGWPSDISKDDAALIKSGIVLGIGEDWKADGKVQTYVRDGGQYVPLASADEDAQHKDAVEVSVAFIMQPRNMSQLKSADPALFNLLSPLRKKVQDAVADVWRDLLDVAKYGPDGTRKKRERAANAGYSAFLTDMETKALKRFDTCKKNGDSDLPASKELIGLGFRAMRTVFGGADFAVVDGTYCTVADGVIVKPEPPKQSAPQDPPKASPKDRAKVTGRK